MNTFVLSSLWIAMAAASLPGDDLCDAAVLYRSGSDAYQEAVEGVRETMAGAAFKVSYIDQAAAPGKTCLEGSPKVVAAIGIGAWSSLAETHRVLTAFPAMILRSDLKSDSKVLDAVFADVPLAAIAEKLHDAFPGKSRLALIHRSSRPMPDASAIAKVKQMGFELRIVDCSGPDKLLAVFNSLKGQADFAIAEPDGELYNSVTLKPLVFASLDKRLPIVGFSAAFVRAGALLGVYPDFHELGRQIGEEILRVLSGKGQHSEEGPRKVVIAVNERISRLMGVEPADHRGVLTFR